ncbi:MAG TPA: CBS domain-containing protein [Solirubrobacteraceae bacterium]|jgi:CBS domain-containing protein/sporulation protein YlmC with PRC-barrel domain
MDQRIVYLSRLRRLPLLGPDGAEIGRIDDAVIDRGSKPPRVNGLVIAVQRRKVFVAIGRVGEIAAEGARLRRGSVNVRHFELREGERLLWSEVVDTRLKGERVVDIGLTPTPEEGGWEVATVVLAPRRVPGLGPRGVPGLRRAPDILDWSESGELFASERSVDRQAAELDSLHPAEMAAAIRKLPLHRRKLLASELEDDRFADLLEELSEDDQVRLIEGMDLGRLARILDEMDADDAADLIGELPAGRQAELLTAMDPEEAEPVRRLLSYDPETAGGLMTPEPLILSSESTVAEALARVRERDIPVPLAAGVFVCRPPLETPTGRYLGNVGFQRLLREAPSKPLGRCIDENVEPLKESDSKEDVAAQLAAYDVVSLAVVDDAGRLVGAVTIDDVLDRVLPADWRVAISHD